MALRKATDFTPKLETVYDGRFPSLSDMLRQGGLPGVEYFLCNSANIAGYQAQSADLVAGLPAFEIRGPRGVASAFLMCRGNPIPGADPLNGVRRYAIDPQLVGATGLDPESTNAGTTTEGQAQDREGDARAQGGNAAQLVGTEGDKPQAGGRDRSVGAARVREATPQEHA